MTGPPVVAASECGSATGLADVVATFRRWLHLPDPAPLYAVLGALAANRMPGDPVWLVLVGPPGSGKTEILGSLAGLPRVHFTGTLTEPSLLSGSPKRDRAKDARGGLLREIGDDGILVCKDFGSVLSMHREQRGQVLAALREIYDGSWTRHVGSDGGRTLHWSGRVGLVAGCTPAIDRHAAVIAAMGDRFALFRLRDVNGDAQAERALEHAGAEAKMRRELARAVAGLFSVIELEGLEAEPLTEAERERLIYLASLVARARSAIERDGYSREIELIPDPESPTRLAVVLDRLRRGLRAIGLDAGEAWRIVAKVAADSMPALRRRVLDLLSDGRRRTTTEVATALDYPTNTAVRALEDLTAHGVCRRYAQGRGKAHEWELTDWALARYAATSPETSDGGESSPETSGGVSARVENVARPAPFTLPLRIEEDLSGEVPPEGGRP